MDLTQLRYFRAIARHSSMTAAARALRVSQPTLSLSIKRLEEELSTKLFLRHRGGVSLTAAGEELVLHVDEVMQLLDRAAERIAGLSTGLSGSFVIGCHEALGAYFLPSVLPRIAKKAPELEVMIFNAPSSQVLGAVADRTVHFGIVVNPRPMPELVQRELFRDAIDLFTVASDPRPELPPEEEYGRTGAAFDDLEQARAFLNARPLIYPGRVGECLELLEELKASGVEPDRLMECGDFTLAKSLAVAGVGAALLPRRIARGDAPRPLQRVHHALPVYRDAIHLVFREDIHRTRSAVFVKDELLACGAEMPSVAV